MTTKSLYLPASYKPGRCSFDCAPDKAFPYDQSLTCGAALRMTVLVHDLYGPDVTHDMEQCAALVGTLRMTSLAISPIAVKCLVSLA